VARKALQHRIAILLAVLLFVVPAARAQVDPALEARLQKLDSAFTPEVFRDVLPYRLFAPETSGDNERYPLVIYLHGSGGIGTDNRKNFEGGNILGSRIWALPENQAKHPCFIIVPQAPSLMNAWTSEIGDRLVELLEELAETRPIDRARIYITGQSLGGIGTWQLVSKHPALFAAALPLCGLARPDDATAYANSGTAIWAFHGAKDPVIPVSGTRAGSELAGSRTIIEAIRTAGGVPRYTEYREVGHGVWEHAYIEPELIEWLFAQHRPATD